MKPDFTPQQKEAIETTGESLLVSAAAGSGKTAVLAQRCAYLVCDAPEEQRCDVDELLVVTFTNAAAEEMRKRIGHEIAGRAARSDDARLQRQAMLIHAAQISTIHSLGSAIVRRHFHDLGIEPSFRLLDADEARLLRGQIVDEMLDERFDDPDAGEFRRFVSEYANGQPRKMADIVLGLDAKLESVIDAHAWLHERHTRVEEAANRPVRDSQLGRGVLKVLALQLDTLIASASRLAVGIHRVGKLSAYVDHVRKIESVLRDWRAALDRETWDEVAARVKAFRADRLPKMDKSPEKEAAQARIGKLRKRIGAFIESSLFCFSETALREGLQSTLWAIDQVTGLAREFQERYRSAKRDSGTLDFSDLERLALQLLREPGSSPPAPSKIAREYQRQFRYVLVDEYQDVNAVQDTIIDLLSRSDNHFAVGDVKQSIYRFRQADPERFIRRYEAYTPEDAPGRLIRLQRNFRSRGPLLEALNGLFHALMTLESAEVEYDDSQKLVPGAKYPEPGPASDPSGPSPGASGLFHGTPIELHVVEKVAPGALADRLEADEREAVVAAERIRRLLGHDGSPPARVVTRDNNSRPIEPRDIVVLLRALRVKAERFANILRQANIPVQADSTTGFFNATEVGDMLSVLELLCNARNDIALAGFLRSSLSGWSAVEDKLLQVRLAFPARAAPCFHQALWRYARERDDALSERIRRTLEQLDRWRGVALSKPVADVVWAILQETSYLAYVSGLPDGPQRVANVMHLHERARQFESFQRPTVARFLAFLASIEEEGDLGMPAAAGVAQNAVRIMSIHKSKGLEFPVVIVPDLGKDHNLRDASARLLMEDVVGVAARVVDAEKEVHYASLASTLASHQIRHKQIAEELRVLYVAGTRAKEHLILIGTESLDCAPDWDDYAWAQEFPIPPGDVQAGGCMLDWIGPASAMVERVRPGSFERTLHTAADIASRRDALRQAGGRGAVRPELARLEPLPAPPVRSNGVRQMIDLIERAYPHQAMTTEPAVTSVTSLTKRGKFAPGGKQASDSGVVAFDHLLKPPRFLAGDALSPADRGSVTHTVLQRLDFSGPCDQADLQRQMRSMVDRRFLRAGDIGQVDIDAILWLLGQPLGLRLRSAGQVLRELDLTFTQPAPGGSAAAGDRVMVRGRIDAVIVEPDGLCLIDYKTDRVTVDTVEQRRQFYLPQVHAYREHLARVARRPVREAHLVFLGARQVLSA